MELFSGRVLSNRIPKHILGINCCLNDNNDLFFTQVRNIFNFKI